MISFTFNRTYKIIFLYFLKVWLTLYQLLLHPEAQRKYEFNSYRKTQLLKVRLNLQFTFTT